MGIQVSINVLGNRFLVVDDLIYEFSEIGSLISTQEAILSPHLRSYGYRDCKLISIIKQNVGQKVVGEVATFNSDNKIVDKKELSGEQIQQYNDTLNSKGLSWFLIVKPQYVRLVYILEG